MIVKEENGSSPAMTEQASIRSNAVLSPARDRGPQRRHASVLSAHRFGVGMIRSGLIKACGEACCFTYVT